MVRPPASEPSSPFATPSFEPRFAIDGSTPEMLEHALRLHVLCNNATGAAYVEGKGVFRGFHSGGRRLAVAASLHGFPGDPRGPAWEPAFRDLDRGQALDAIRSWLREAAGYPETPWFDGGEARGFRLYHVPYGELDLGPYGFMVVEPKWIEVHK